MIRSDKAPKKELEPFNFNLIKTYDIESLFNYVKNFKQEWILDTSRQDAIYEDRRNPHLFTNTYTIQDHRLDWEFGSMINVEIKDDSAYELIKKIVADLEDHFVGKAARILLIKLNSNNDVSTHTDGGDYLSSVKRCHIPIITNEKVTYTVDNETIHMAKGECWEINNFKPHSVKNSWDQDRVHLLIDILPEYTFRNFNNINNNSKIYLVENFIDENDSFEMLNYIKENYKNTDKFPKTRGFDKHKRDRYEANIPETVSLDKHIDKIEIIKKYSQKTLNLFKEYFKDDGLFISAFWMTVLGKETRLPLHADNHEGAEHLYRSAVIYLNDDFEGGYLRFKDHELTYKPKKNSIVIFPSDYVHQITPIVSGTRYAMPIWASKNEIYDIFSNNNTVKSDPNRYLKGYGNDS